MNTLILTLLEKTACCCFLCFIMMTFKLTLLVYLPSHICTLTVLNDTLRKILKNTLWQVWVLAVAGIAHHCPSQISAVKFRELTTHTYVINYVTMFYEMIFHNLSNHIMAFTPYNKSIITNSSIRISITQ